MQEFTLFSLAYAVSGAANSDADIVRVISMPKIVFTIERVVVLCFVTRVILLLISFLSVVRKLGYTIFYLIVITYVSLAVFLFACFILYKILTSCIQ